MIMHVLVNLKLGNEESSDAQQFEHSRQGILLDTESVTYVTGQGTYEHIKLLACITPSTRVS